MKRAMALGFLLSASWLRAQTAPAPEMVLDVNAQSDAVVAGGWPLLIRAVLISADGNPVSVALKSGAWTQALHLTVTDQKGASQTWPVQLVQPPTATLALSSVNTAEAVWLVAPADTAAIAPGVYNFSVTLDTTSTAAAGAWSGTAAGTGAGVTLQTEPASLSAEDEASKYLAFAAYSRLKGDTQGIGSALDTLIAHQPSMLEASKEKADLLASNGDYAGALSLYQLTLSNFLSANPNAKEPLTLLTRPIDAMVAKVVAQQQSSSGPTVTSVAPGRTEPVIAPDSIVDAYGAVLATQTATASTALSTSLGGTTVTIMDSTGASAAAQLFYVSPVQVDYAAPASLALGAATVTVKAGDGTVSTGPVMVANVQPAVFILNAAGLVAGGILRVTGAGQVNENLYAVDPANNVVPAPVDVSKDQVYLVFYATGLRRASQSQVSVSVGGVSVPVSYAGAQGFYVGLDQVNVQLPASLSGRGDVPVVLAVGGNQANQARITIK
jgi:uncharacterized protein (TIGR03437 family)